MISRTSYTFLAQREPVQQGTRFVHKGLHIFIPVLHHLFQQCSVLQGRATKPEYFPLHTILCQALVLSSCTPSCKSQEGTGAVLPFLSLSSQAVLSSIIISLPRRLTATQLLELEVGSLQAPSKGQQHLLFHPNIFPLFSEAEGPIAIDSQKHLPVQSQSHQQHYSSLCDTGGRRVPLSWSSSVTLQTYNGSEGHGLLHSQALSSTVVHVIAHCSSQFFDKSCLRRDSEKMLCLVE